jgi:hypothetical protein
VSLELILVAAALSGATLAYVLSPLLWPPEAPVELSDEALEALLQRRAAAYQAIRELESDFRLGKLDEPTYEAARADLEARAVALLRSLDEWEADADVALARFAGAQMAHAGGSGEHDAQPGLASPSAGDAGDQRPRSSRAARTRARRNHAREMTA